MVLVPLLAAEASQTRVMQLVQRQVEQHVLVSQRSTTRTKRRLLARTLARSHAIVIS